MRQTISFKYYYLMGSFLHFPALAQNHQARVIRQVTEQSSSADIVFEVCVEVNIAYVCICILCFFLQDLLFIHKVYVLRNEVRNFSYRKQRKNNLLLFLVILIQELSCFQQLWIQYFQGTSCSEIGNSHIFNCMGVFFSAQKQIIYDSLPLGIRNRFLLVSGFQKCLFTYDLKDKAMTDKQC